MQISSVKNIQADNFYQKKAEKKQEESHEEEITKLKNKDSQVKAHESAHLSLGAGIVKGGAKYEYQTGPDGKRYAVAGEVQIDVSKEDTPEATIRKMDQVRRAALAPSDPSPQDIKVASEALKVQNEARQQKANENDKNNAKSTNLNIKV